jgi:alkylhydroperoxidase/carboxymuconolactone decarboxylase family protein YurZ
MSRSLIGAYRRHYAGWPNVFSALPVVKEVIEKRLE